MTLSELKMCIEANLDGGVSPSAEVYIAFKTQGTKRKALCQIDQIDFIGENEDMVIVAEDRI